MYLPLPDLLDNGVSYTRQDIKHTPFIYTSFDSGLTLSYGAGELQTSNLDPGSEPTEQLNLTASCSRSNYELFTDHLTAELIENCSWTETEDPPPVYHISTLNISPVTEPFYIDQSSLEPEDEARGTNILDLNKENKIFNKEEKVLNTEEKDLKKEEKFVLKGEKKKLCVTEEEIQKTLLKLRPLPVSDGDKIPPCRTPKDSLVSFIEEYLLNNVSCLAEAIAQEFTDKRENKIKLGSNNTQSIPHGPSKPTKSLDEEFKDCFDAWNVDTASEPVFGLWRDPGESAILADYQLNKSSSQLPVSWSSVKYSKHICSVKCPKSRKRKID
ncbi:uncharacterized protein LOC111703185 [Eurytemora carolleeae]|uniref:uncharacterized protein LOC111703185 n=1 Tax=Eurytemora carolleeae TaxID=1294199 RepID=UPI000C773AF6|nr:uncharacterized protein LOC111703185 [Eurytemora carolleeae]|eukprot:XP_023330827.1 uncharacterized protein LOC111703185 [Eurytemora affinis]